MATTLEPKWHLADKYKDVFFDGTLYELPPLREINHNINLKDPNQIQKPQPIKPKERYMDQLREKIDEELKSGRIYRSTDSSSCALFMLPRNKKDATKARFLHDLRQRNKNTILDLTPIPDQQLIIRTLARAKFRSKIDLKDGYHQVRINPDHEKYTAFTTPFGTFRTRIMQMGDCNAPATFMKLMTHVLRDGLGRWCFVYLDDILIFSDTYKDHLNHIR